MSVTSAEVGMTSSSGACGRDVDRRLMSDYELHSTSIACGVGDTVRHTTSGLAAYGTTGDTSMSEVSGQSFRRRDHDDDGWTTGRMDCDVSNADSRYVTDDLVPASTTNDDVERSQDDDDSNATASRQSSASLSSSDALTSSCTAVSCSYMHLRSKTSR